MKFLSKITSGLFTSVSVSLPLVLTSSLVLQPPVTPLLDASSESFSQLSFQKPTIRETSIMPKPAPSIKPPTVESLPKAPPVPDGGLPSTLPDTAETEKQHGGSEEKPGPVVKKSETDSDKQQKDQETSDVPKEQTPPESEKKQETIPPPKPNQVGTRQINPVIRGFLEFGRSLFG